MRDSFFLAWRYLCHYRLTTGILTASISLIIFLPAALQVIVKNAQDHFRSRAETTPLVIGPKGSPLELVLGSVYFDKPYENVLRMNEFQRVEEQEIGQAVPLFVKFWTRDSPIVGTTLEYFQRRDLRIATGRPWSMLGECLIGSRVADQLGLNVGGKIPVSSSTTFLLDSPPLRLHVVGILAPSETPDDDAIFVDLETTWIIEGLGHGHAPKAKHGSSEAELYTDITEENVGSFHFHGDRNGFPISAIIVFPTDEKSRTLLLGKYFSPEETAQIVRPQKVMDAMLERVLMVRSYIAVIVVVVSFVTLVMIGLVMVLSVRLRQTEINTIFKMGCSRFTIAAILGSQILIILALGSALALIMTWVTNQYGPEVVRALIL